MRRTDTMLQAFMTLSALAILLVFPEHSYAMIELLPAFFVIAIGGVILAGALIASIVKTVIIRYLAAGENLPSFKRIAAVAISDMITMSLSLTIAFASVQAYLVPANPHKTLVLVTFFIYATVLHVFIAILPNSFLIEPRAGRASSSERAFSRIAVAAILAFLTPLVVSSLCLIIGYSLVG
jgi:hypothetical protein